MTTMAGQSFQKAKNTVYRLLKYRLRSEQEIRNKLKEKQFSEPVIDETVLYFKDVELIDDRLFTRAWIQSRLKKPFGSRRIQMELIRKGISKDIQNEELARASDNYDEETTVLDLARHRAQKYKPTDDKEKIRKRVYDYLMRRGFSGQSIIKAIKKL